jgi:hypothetical protein
LAIGFDRFFGPPPIVHALGIKPWRVTGNALAHVTAELHPYISVARRFVPQIRENPAWMRPHSTPARLLLVLGFGSNLLAGMLLQIIVKSYQTVLPIARLLRRR